MALRAGMSGFLGTIGQPTAQVIDGSLKFQKANSTSLTRTPGSAGNRSVYTGSVWIKRTQFAPENTGNSNTHNHIIFSAGSNSGSNVDDLSFYKNAGGDDNRLRFQSYPGSTQYEVISNAKFRDPNGWYNVTWSYDGNTAKFYINGEEIIFLDTNTQNGGSGGHFNNTVQHVIGRTCDLQNSGEFDGYMSQFYWIDGLKLGPSYFGFTDPLTNTWRPKKFRAEGTTVNDGTQWSSHMTSSTGSFYGGGGPDKLFDGLYNTAVDANTNSGSVTFTPPSIIHYKNSVKVYQNQSGVDFVITDANDVTITYSKGSGGGLQWLTIVDGKGGSIKSMSCTPTTNDYCNWRLLEIDGVIMVDSTTQNLAFGTNGFYLPMDNQDDFEKDKSGNGNDFTKNNFSGTSIDPDIVKDSPSGAVFGGRSQTGITTTSSAPANYATLNPININDMVGTTSVTLSDGNLTMANARNTYFGSVLSTLSMTSGKYYCEGTVDSNDASTLTIGALKIDPLESRWNTSDEQAAYFANGYAYRSNNGYKESASSSSSYGNSYGNGDTIGIALDLDAKTISFYKNGVNQGIAYSGIPAGRYAFIFSCSETNNKWKANFGQKPFKYAPPQGHLPLNSATVRPNNVIARPDQYVGITTWKGDGNTGRQIRTLSFSPDLVWIKQSSASRAHAWFDTVRGANKRLQSSTTNGETTHTDQMSAFLSNGFTVEDNNTVNVLNGIYRGFCWKAGGSKNTFNIDDVGYATAAAAGLDGGTINPTGASIGTRQGFSIIGYTGTDNASDTFAHGLTQKPDFALFKNRSQDGDDWISYNSTVALGATRRVKFNTADGSDSQTSQFNDTEPTSSLFTIGTYDNINKLNNNYIAYIWHNVPGLQQFGEFPGDGGTNDGGLFIETGFRPALIWLRPFAGSGIANNGGWYIWDVQNDSNPYNDDSAVSKPGNYFNYGNLNNGMDSHAMAGIDILSNGFKLRTDTAGYSNYSGWTYIYCAFAEAPASNLYGGQSNAR